MGWWIHGTKTGEEFAVQARIRDLGAFAWVAREFATTRPPTKRRHVPVVRPLKDLGRSVIYECDDDTWHKIQGVKGLTGTYHRLPDVWVERRVARLMDGTTVPFQGLKVYMERIDTDFEDRKARFEAGETLAAYQPGDALQVLAGPLAGQLVTFTKIVQGATDLEDRLRATMPLLGGWVPVTLDPLHVAKVAAE